MTQSPDQNIRDLVADWPELSPTQAKRIAALLRSDRQETPAVKDEWDV